MGFRLLILGLFFLLTSSSYAASFESFQNVNSDVSSVLEFESKIFYSVKDKLYCLDGATSKKIYDIRTDEYLINRIVVSNQRLFICAENGLYEYVQGRVIKILDKTIADDYLSFNDIEFYENKYLMATSDGVYQSDDLNHMKRFGQLPKSFYCKRLSRAGEVLYVLGSTVLYKYENVLEKIYDIGMDTEKKLVDILIIDGVIYMASAKGLYYYQSGRLRPFDTKLIGLAVNKIGYEANKLYVATDHGLFICETEKHIAKRSSGELALAKINSLVSTSQGLLIATVKGLYKQSAHSFDAHGVTLKFKYGPDIKKLQSVVIRYNEVSNKKIINWRRRLKGRALMPDLSVGYDKTLYGTAGGSTYDGKHYRGPDDWSVSMSWDLGNLVYDNDETSIDNRSRLNTQQRIDILEEVSRIYFERKRAVFKYNNEQNDAQKQFEKQILIEELTASLDAYSGGWFSRNL